MCFLVNHASPAARPHVRYCGLTLLSEWTRQERSSSEVFPDGMTKVPRRHFVLSRLNDAEIKHFPRIALPRCLGIEKMLEDML